MGGEHDIALLKLRMDHYWGWLLGRNHMSRFWEIGKQIRIPQRSPDLVRYTGLCQHVMTCGFKELLGQWISISFQCWLCNRLQFIGCPILSDDLVRCGFKIYVGLDMLDWIGLKTGWWSGTWILYFSIYIYWEYSFSQLTLSPSFFRGLGQPPSRSCQTPRQVLIPWEIWGIRHDEAIH